MAFCGSCGAALAEGSAYCGACGHSAQASSAGASAVANPASGGTGLTMNLAAALTYILGAITGMLFLVIEPYKSNRLVRFHAMQSIFFCVVCIAFAILWNILWGILASVLGFWVLTIDLPLRLLIALAIFGYWLYVMFQAYSQREYRIPWIGNFAAKQVG